MEIRKEGRWEGRWKGGGGKQIAKERMAWRKLRECYASLVDKRRKKKKLQEEENRRPICFQI